MDETIKLKETVELANDDKHKNSTYIIFYDHYTLDDQQTKIDGYKIDIVNGNKNLKKVLYNYYKYCYFMCVYVFDDIVEKENVDGFCKDDNGFDKLVNDWFHEKYNEDKIMAQSVKVNIADVFEFLKKYLKDEKLDKIVKIMKVNDNYTTYE